VCVLLAAPAAADEPQPRVREATILQVVPDIGMDQGGVKTCGIRVVFRDSESADPVGLYDLTVATAGKKGETAATGIVRATEIRGNSHKNANPQPSDRLPPVDVAFAIPSLREPIRIHNPVVVAGTLLAPVDLSNAPQQALEFTGPLLRRLANGEPVLVLWSASATDQRAFRVKTTPDPDLIDTVQNCLQNTLSLDPLAR
jgi:hypothetical protein